MKTLIHYQAEPGIVNLRLFDSRRGVRDINFIDLLQFIQYEFIVVEVIGGQEEIVLHKKNDSISTSKEIDSSRCAVNTVHIKFVPSDTINMKPNPPNKDRLRYFTLKGQHINHGWSAIETGYFYLDSMAAV